jgi:ribosomal protein S18 acetylase RimI-like enzyme
MALSACNVFQIEADRRYVGDLLLEDQRKDTKYILDFSLLPEYQGKGIGKAVVERFKEMGGKFTAVTRKETLGFFLKSGFVLRRTIKDYYHPGVDGYFIFLDGKNKG